MNGWLTFFLGQMNVGVMLGLMLGALVLLRPVLTRLLSPQQRVVLWMAVWGFGHLNAGRRTGKALPITFHDLVVPRTGQLFQSDPAFLPDTYTGPGPYHLALPGGGLVRVGLSDVGLVLLSALWVAGMAALLVLFVRRSRALVALGRQGRLLDREDPLKEYVATNWTVDVWVSPQLPASFVRYLFFDPSHEIYLQAELSPEQMKLVLMHESRHISLWHPWWKVMATFSLVEFWWNPLVWLGFRYFCRDLELACDASVMKRLGPEERKRYAEMLLELGTGRQLWEAPLAFGECDAAARVKAAAVWRPWKWWRRLLTGLAAAVLCLFFWGGSRVNYLPQDMVLFWERTAGTQAFVETLNDEMAQTMGLIPVGSGEQAPDLGITEVWEAPDQRRTDAAGNSFDLTALWVRGTGDTWYLVTYGWYGEGADFIVVLSVKEVPEPDLAGCDRLI